MNWLDIVILVTLVLIGFLGWRTGVIKAVFGAVGVVAGVFLAGRFAGPLGESLDFITNENLAKAVGFAIVFAVIFVAAMVAAKFLRKLLKLVLLGWVDGLGGAVLGLVAGSLLWVGLIGLVGSFPIGGLDRSIEGSSMATFLADKVPFGLSLLPEEYKGVRSLLDRVRGGGDVTVALNGVAVERVSLSGLTGVATIAVSNPTGSAGTISRVRYQFHLLEGEDAVLLEFGLLEDEAPLEAEATTDVQIPLDLTGDKAATFRPLIEGLIRGESATFRVEGLMTVVFPSGAQEIEFQGQAEVRAPE